MKTGFLPIRGQLGNATALLLLSQTHTTNSPSSPPLHVPCDIHVPFCIPSPQKNRAELQPNNAESAQVLPITPQTGALFGGSLPQKAIAFHETHRNLIETYTPLQIWLKSGQQVERLITCRHTA